MGASSATWGYAFRGARIIAAVITDLLSSGMGAGSELLWAGCSAGAIGAMQNMEAVHDLVEPAGVQMKSLLDAAALLNIQPAGWPWSSSLVPLQTLMGEVVALVKPGAA